VRGDSSQHAGAVRRSVDGLAPVVLGAKGASRYASFCDRIERIDGQDWLILSPIAAADLPPSGTPVDVTAPDDGWRISARSLRGLGPTSAGVLLDGAVLTPLAGRPRRARPGSTEPLTLLVPGNLDNLESRVFPVVDLGPHHCSVDVTTPFEPGRPFAVEIFGARRVLRRASASVLEIIPWYSPQGERVFRCRLALAPVEQTGTARVYDVVGDPVRVAEVLRFASALDVRARARTQAPTPHHTTVKLAEVGHDWLAFQRPDGVEGCTRFAPGTIVQIRFELFAFGFEMDVRVLADRGERVETAYPLLLRRRQWRREQRVFVGDAAEPVSVRFYNAATAKRVTRPVLDLSFGGLCFRADDVCDVLWPGLTLEKVELIRGRERIPLADLEVCATEDSPGGPTCHVSISAPGQLDDARYIDLLASLRHPELVAEDGEHFRPIIDLHHAVGLMAPHMERNLAADLEATERTWRGMHAQLPQVCRTLYCTEDDHVVATVSAVRAYERAWTAQHMSALPGRRWRSPAALDLAYTEHIVPRTDAHFTVMWVKVGNKRQTDFLGRFIELTGTGEAGSRVRLDLWIGRGPGAATLIPVAPDVAIRRMRRADELLVSRAARRTLGDIAAAALSLEPGQVELPETERTFRRAGIQRSRHCYIATRGGVPAMAVLHEHADPGINMTCVLGATWLIPIRPELDADGAVTRTVIAQTRAVRPASTAGDRFLLAPAGFATAEIQASGYGFETAVDLYAYNRAGLQRWYDYVHETRGRMHMRAEQRAARISGVVEAVPAGAVPSVVRAAGG
jgi:hypothetical protein